MCADDSLKTSFCSVEFLLLGGIPEEELIANIQEHGAYAYNTITGRVSEAAVEECKAAMNLLADRLYPEPLYDDAELARLAPGIGWPAECLPELISKKIPEIWARQADFLKLLQGLLILAYPDRDILAELVSKDSSALADIQRDLDLKGYAFSLTTLRRYLKHAPDIPPPICRSQS